MDFVEVARELHGLVMEKRSAVILLVDDDSALGLAMVDVLAEHGHLARFASTAEEALTLLTAPHRFDVVILDLQLGSERGEWLVDRLRDHGSVVPAIVIHSGQALPELERASRVIHAEVMLHKPCSPQRLLEAIELARR